MAHTASKGLGKLTFLALIYKACPDYAPDRYPTLFVLLFWPYCGLSGRVYSPLAWWLTRAMNLGDLRVSGRAYRGADDVLRNRAPKKAGRADPILDGGQRGLSRCCWRELFAGEDAGTDRSTGREWWGMLTRLWLRSKAGKGVARTFPWRACWQTGMDPSGIASMSGMAEIAWP